jgi:ArsR family transcriptional regulator, arsenate/arsenite/antimonite-responsive transcriptional repressor
MKHQPSPAITPDTEEADADKLANLCKALAHPARIRILKHLLAEKQCLCGRIVELLPLAQSTVSQHLKILKESGLVQGEVEGPKVCYCVDKTKLKSICASISTLCDLEETSEKK